MSQCRRVDVAKNSCSLVTFYSISLSFFFFPERPLIRRPMHSSVKSRRSSGPGTLCETAEEVWVGFFWRSRRLAFEHECFAVRYIPSATKRVSSPKAGRPCSCFYHIKHPLPFCIFASKHAPNSIMPLPFVPPIVRKSRLGGGGGATGALGSTLLEAVLELAVDGLQVLHAARAGGLSSLGLLAPVDCGNMLVDVQGRSHALAMSIVFVAGGRRVVCDVHFLTLALG